MKLVSWNVNGLRACIQKGFLEQFQHLDADFFCLQETKLQEGQIDLHLPGYEQYWCYAEKKGYSGTAIFTKHTPLTVSYGLGVPELDNEGRLITLEYPEFYLVTCYTPNAQRGLARIDHRLRWDDAFRSYIKELDSKKPVILCGDLNVAHKEIDLKNPGSNRGNAGFSDEERESFTKTLDAGFTDTFRYLHPDTKGAYTWWSYMFHARENNAGWRIDYFLVSDRIRDTVYKAPIYPDIMGSDHCPVGLELDIKCNGGIWSPECIDLEPPKAAEKAPESKKTAPALKAGAIAILTLCLLLGGGLLFGINLPIIQEKVASELISVHLYHSPVEMVPFTAWSSDPVAHDGKRNWQIDEEDPVFNTQLNFHPINFWLRIDMTQLGNIMISKDDEIVLSYTANGKGPTQLPFFHSQPYCYTVREYYDNDTRTGPAGWFVYGFIPQAGNAKIYLKQNGVTSATPLEILTVTPYTGSVSSTAELVTDCINNEDVYTKYITADNFIVYWNSYRSMRITHDAVKNLEYRGYEAAQLLFEEFRNNADQRMKTCAEALLSIPVYNNQLTLEQQQYLIDNCVYHLDGRNVYSSDIVIPD